MVLYVLREKWNRADGGAMDPSLARVSLAWSPWLVLVDTPSKEGGLLAGDLVLLRINERNELEWCLARERNRASGSNPESVVA